MSDSAAHNNGTSSTLHQGIKQEFQHESEAHCNFIKYEPDAIFAEVIQWQEENQDDSIKTEEDDAKIKTENVFVEVAHSYNTNNNVSSGIAQCGICGAQSCEHVGFANSTSVIKQEPADDPTQQQFNQ